MAKSKGRKAKKGKGKGKGTPQTVRPEIIIIRVSDGVSWIQVIVSLVVAIIGLVGVVWAAYITVSAGKTHSPTQQKTVAPPPSSKTNIPSQQGKEHQPKPTASTLDTISIIQNNKKGTNTGVMETLTINNQMPAEGKKP